MTDEFALKINPYAMIVSGEDNAREAVRVLFREGADHIKIVGTGTLTVDEMKAIVDQAHRLGGKVHAHAEDPREVKDVLKLDVDLIIHSRAVFDEEAIKKIAERNIFLVPTLALRLVDFKKLFPPFENFVNSHQGVTGLPIHKSEEYCKMVDDGVRRAHELGVKIACGSDVWLEPITPFSSYSIMEVKFLADALSPMDAIVSATKTSAEALGIEEHVGTVETGKLADLILVKGNPLEDINVLTDKNNIKQIIKEGKTMMRFQEAHKSLRIIKPKTKHF